MMTVLAMAACEQSNEAPCQRSCQREAECASNLQVKFDRSECVEMCTTLERSAAGAVRAHVACVDGAVSCEAVLSCR